MKKLNRAIVASLLTAGATALGPLVLGGRAQSPLAMTGEQEEEAGAWHEMDGTVSAVEANVGMVSLSTEAGTLRLNFPPESVRDLKRGDKITAALAFWTTPASRPAPPAADVPESPPIGDHILPGTVDRIDHATGGLDVQTEKGLLQLHFPVRDLRGLKSGDRITLQLVYYKGGAAPRLTRRVASVRREAADAMV